jgi:hypothetical protein
LIFQELPTPRRFDHIKKWTLSFLPLLPIVVKALWALQKHFTTSETDGGNKGKNLVVLESSG